MNINCGIRWPNFEDRRADVLVGESSFGTSLAIEIQLTRQSAERTYQRTAQRAASGTPTLWVFGQNSSTGHLGADLLASTSVFSAVSPTHAADVSEAVCLGHARFDDLSAFAKTPARPIAALIRCNCGTKWLRPMGVVLLPNRARGDQTPIYASCSITCTEAGTETLNAPAGRAGAWHMRIVGPGSRETLLSQNRAVFVRRFTCPKWGTEGNVPQRGAVRSPIPGRELTRCPLPIAACIDARPVLRADPGWLIKPLLAREEPTMQWPNRRKDSSTRLMSCNRTPTLSLLAENLFSRASCSESRASS
jgi:hypothetical protein